MYKIFMSLSILPRLWCGTVILFVGRTTHSAARHKKRFRAVFHLFSVPCGKQGRCRQSPGRILPAAFLRHRVIAPAPQRIAPGDAPCGQQKPFDAAMGADSLDAVLAATGREAAVAAKARTDEPLIKANHPAQCLLRPTHFSAERAGGRVAGGFAPGCLALSGRPACANSLATTVLSCQLLSRGVMPRATKTRS